MKKFICPIAIAVALFLPVYVQAASPLQTVENHVNQLLTVDW